MAYYDGCAQGSPWRGIAERYGSYTTCVNRFNRWRKAGIWQRLIEGVSRGYDGRVPMIVSTVVRVHHHGGQGKKRHFVLFHGSFTRRINSEGSCPG